MADAQMTQTQQANHALSSGQRPHSAKGTEFSAQFKQREAMRLQKISGRPPSSSSKSQMAHQMMQASMMQNNMMMMMQMMTQQQQSFAANRMAWSPQQQHVPTSDVEAVAHRGPSSVPRSLHYPQQAHRMQNPYVAATSAPSSMNIRPSSDTASHVNRQPTVPKASSASNIETATQPATQQNVQPDRAADADESGFDRKAALQVLQAVEAKFEELCKYQGKLVAKINNMQDRIAKKDAMIDRLRVREAASEKQDIVHFSFNNNPLAAELEERDALTNELSRLQLQMANTQHTMEDAMETGKALAGQFDDAPSSKSQVTAVPEVRRVRHATGGMLQTGGASNADAGSGAVASGAAGAAASRGATESVLFADSNMDSCGTENSAGARDTGSVRNVAGAVPMAADGTAGANGIAGRAGDPEEIEQAAVGAEGGAVQTEQPGQVDQLGYAEQPQHAGQPGHVEGLPHTFEAQSADQLSVDPHSEGLAGSKRDAAPAHDARKVMSWKQLATPTSTSSALLRKTSLRSNARGRDEHSERSASTAADSDSVRSSVRSQHSPTARGRRHVFKAAPCSAVDSTESTSVRLPKIPDASWRKRAEMDRLFQR